MITLGRSDRVDLPEFGITNLHAKIDTGAYRSSIHCSRAEVVADKLEFVILDEEHPEFTGMTFSTTNFTQRSIKNSFGKAELRFVIKTRISLFNKTYLAEFSLSDRAEMKFPLLLGRKLLKRRFLIDVGQKDLSFNRKHSGV